MTTRQVRVSDLSGDEGAIEMTFGYERQTFHVDLTPPEVSEFDRFMSKYIAVARRVSIGVPARRPVPRTSPQERARIRLWAREHGLRCASSGQIPNDVYKAYVAQR